MINKSGEAKFTDRHSAHSVHIQGPGLLRVFQVSPLIKKTKQTTTTTTTKNSTIVLTCSYFLKLIDHVSTNMKVQNKMLRNAF